MTKLNKPVVLAKIEPRRNPKSGNMEYEIVIGDLIVDTYSDIEGANARCAEINVRRKKEAAHDKTQEAGS